MKACVRVCSDTWITDLIPIGIGVPQGCTASTINFNTTFELPIDYHAFLVREIGYKISSIGYKISNNIVVSNPTYADDVALVNSSVANDLWSVLK